jgi:hypothetical protein
VAAAARREQHETDAAYTDRAVEGHVTAAHGLIAAGAVHQTWLGHLAQAIEAELDQARRSGAAAASALELRGAVLVRRAEGTAGAVSHHTRAVSEGDLAVCWGLNDAGQRHRPCASPSNLKARYGRCA